MKNCPVCGEKIQDTARKCIICGEWIEDKYLKKFPKNAKLDGYRFSYEKDQMFYKDNVSKVRYYLRNIFAYIILQVITLLFLAFMDAPMLLICSLILGLIGLVRELLFEVKPRKFFLGVNEFGIGYVLGDKKIISL